VHIFVPTAHDIAAPVTADVEAAAVPPVQVFAKVAAKA
jgi:hypothetical protein